VAPARSRSAPRLARAAALGGATLVALSLALPWGASGRRWRTAIELLRLARRLDVASGAAASVLIVAGLLVPVLAAAAWVAAALDNRPVTAALTGSVALIAIALGYAVVRSPLKLGAGMPIGMGAGALALIGAIAVLALRGDR
jgi:hypothetical protein